MFEIILFEQHVDKLVKQNQLEGKLAETKFAKAQVEMMHEKELLLRVIFLIISPSIDKVMISDILGTQKLPNSAEANE